MKKVLEYSFGGTSIKMDKSWRADFYIDAFKNRQRLRTLYPNDIKKVVEVDPETYRSLGGAAAWGIAAGVLTGGVGLIVGAAYGARRQRTSIYVIQLQDDETLVIETNSGFIHRKLKPFLAADRLEELKRRAGDKLAR